MTEHSDIDVCELDCHGKLEANSDMSSRMESIRTIALRALASLCGMIPMIQRKLFDATSSDIEGWKVPTRSVARLRLRQPFSLGLVSSSLTKRLSFSLSRSPAPLSGASDTSRQALHATDRLPARTRNAVGAGQSSFLEDG